MVEFGYKSHIRISTTQLTNYHNRNVIKNTTININYTELEGWHDGRPPLFYSRQTVEATCENFVTMATEVI